jgi:tRNA(Ile)-lysidine synthase
LRVEAVTVDHRLRAESAAEAAAVAKACAGLGVPHAVQGLGTWAGRGQPDGCRAAGADGADQDWALERGIAHVALGHTRDDQAETVLMGLARRAGLAGLSGCAGAGARGE